MPLFGRKKDEGPKHPGFEEVVERALKAIGREYDLRGDHLDIKLVHGWRGYDVEPVRRRCEARPPDTWLGIVTKDLRQTVELAEREGPVPEWDEAQDNLKLRMHLRGNVPPQYPLGLPFGDDLLAVLAIDRGEGAQLVKLVDANHWGRPFDDLLDIARRNTQAGVEGDIEIERVPLKQGAGEAVLYKSRRWFAASQAMWPERMLGEIGRHGALVATPNCHLAMAYAIDDARALAAIDVLAPWVEARAGVESGAISPHLYWWRPGQTLRLDDARREELAERLGPVAPPEPPRGSTTTGAPVKFKR
jgi:hypothetical protein